MSPETVAVRLRPDDAQLLRQEAERRAVKWGAKARRAARADKPLCASNAVQWARIARTLEQALLEAAAR